MYLIFFCNFTGLNNYWQNSSFVYLTDSQTYSYLWNYTNNSNLINTFYLTIIVDGCFQHTSSIAIATISIHLKWLSLVWPPQTTAININDTDITNRTRNPIQSTQSTISIAEIIIPLGLTTIFAAIGILLITIKFRLGRKHSYTRIPDKD